MFPPFQRQKTEGVTAGAAQAAGYGVNHGHFLSGNASLYIKFPLVVHSSSFCCDMDLCLPSR
jgi:hypothetical protein